MTKALVCALLALPTLAFSQERVTEHTKTTTHVEGRQGRGHYSERVEGRQRSGHAEFYRHRGMWRPERHDRDFYVHRYGGAHLKIINGGWYYFENGCWIAAVGYDPDFDSYTEYEICPGDPLYFDLQF